MTDSFVDLGYRGLALVKRVKLVQIRPSSGYLEMPAPMPVGTALSVTTDDGVAFSAIVTAIHEQVGGSAATPGMEVKPALEGHAASWWSARVSMPDAPPPAPRVIVEPVRAEVSMPIKVSVTAPMAAVTPPPELAASAPPAPSPPPVEDDHSKRTMVMDALSVELLAAEMSASDSSPKLVDDGRKTEMMASVDLAALGLDGGSSGRIPVVNVITGDDDDGGDGADDSKPTERPSQPGVKRRRKKR